MKKYLHKIKSNVFKHVLGVNYATDQYYTRIFNKYDRLETYLSLHQNCLESDYLETGTQIRFLKDVDFGFDIKDIGPYLPTSNYQVLKNEALHTEILFYKIFIADHRVKCQIHFFKGKMFLCTYTFSYLKDSQQNEIPGILQKKYLPGCKYDGQIIRDKHNTCIKIENTSEFILNYMPLNSEAINEIKHFKATVEQQRQEELSARDREIFNKL